ncbi:hypothetical protein [Dickeya poaceiphila]|uniref:Uncharacterized protein n=1 Tax=Dickeya poaceiphila TaxID=568768 RepID=A0A5B8I4J0_9GAMM|nr:hypothetical protein [Dickeya poaceiphila]QDX29511.1 hypothetical protein Dpoa569_0001286 [Dickeya poaceiphila]
MGKYIIVWNENKTQGILLSQENETIDTYDDAFHAGGGMEQGNVASLADAFRNIYGEEQQCSYQCVDIENENSIPIEHDSSTWDDDWDYEDANN